MAFMSSEVNLDLPYAPLDCYTAARNTGTSLQRFKLKSENEVARTLQFSVSIGMASLTWGDIVTIIVTDGINGTSKVNITSTAKVPSVMASVQQNKNVQVVVDALTKALESYDPVDISTPSSPAPSAEMMSPKDRIAALKDLYDSGLISDEEYEQKRSAILSSI